ncbi:MAG: sulfite exporter TauE/SafE family protein [Alphaproteobacteria bacterium]|nr:sulfite exporter TauE/SafE family protein [Alphaproteobacteria bacterium]
MEHIYPLLVVALGFGVLGITGFGSALISVPLLAWVWPLHQVVPLVLSIDFIACLLLGGLQWRLIQLPALLPFFCWLLVGVALGAVLSWVPGVLDSGVLLVALGLYVAWAGWRGLSEAAPRPNSMLRHTPLSGLLGGVIEMLWGTSGSVVVGHLVSRFEDPRVLRAHITLCLMLVSGLACLTLAASGRLNTPEVREWWPPLTAVALVSMLLCHRWSRHAPVARLRRAILGLLVFSGLALALQGGRSLA